MAAAEPKQAHKIFSSANAATDDYANRKVPRKWSWSYWGIMLPITGGGTAGFWLAFGPALAATYGTPNVLIGLGYAIVAQTILGYFLVSASARTRLSSDLATRGLGMGYMGSIATNLVYMVNWFFYWALESQILGSGLASYLGIPPQVGWLIVGIVVFIPLTLYGMVFVTRFQNWTIPIFVLWLAYNVFFIFHNPAAAARAQGFLSYMPAGQHIGFVPVLGAIASINGLVAVIPLLSMEFARFAPTNRSPRRQFWGYLGIAALPQNVPTWWIYLPIGILLWRVTGSTNPGIAFVTLTGWIGFVGLFVTQIRINLQNTYAESMSLSTIFARVFHVAPGRAFWSTVTCLVGTALIFVNMLAYINQVLAVVGVFLFVWCGILVADYAIVRGRMKLSVGAIEHRRAYLRIVNPVGLRSFILGAVVGLFLLYAPDLGILHGTVGSTLAGVASFCGMAVALVSHPLLARRYARSAQNPYLARQPESVPASQLDSSGLIRCVKCHVAVESDDVARCPVQKFGWLCSECCAADSTCGTRCQVSGVAFPSLATAEIPSI